MQLNNRFLDDIAGIANGAAGTFSGIKGEIESMVKQRLERILADMDLISREEFNAVEIMASKARIEQEILQKRIDSLEAKLLDKKLAKKSLKK